MKNKNTLLVLSLVPFLSISCDLKNDGYDMEIEDSNAFVFSQLGDEVMPVFSYIPPYGKEEIIDGVSYPNLETEKIYEDSLSLGINAMLNAGFTDKYETETILSLCDKYSMPCLVNSSSPWITYLDIYKKEKKLIPFEEMSKEDQLSIETAFFKTYEKYSNHPSFAGTCLFDEQGSITNQIVKELSDMIRLKYPGKLLHTNLLGASGNAEQMNLQPFNFSSMDFITEIDYLNSEVAKDIENGKWLKYVEHYLDDAKPQFLSFDHYPFTINNSLQVKYLWELQNAATMCYQRNVPFFYFIQAGKWGDKTRTPDESEFRYEVNTSLAFGVKGIQCFLVYPLNDSEQYGTKTLIDKAIFPFNMDGSHSSIYEPLKNALSYVSDNDDVLMKSTWKGVMETKDLVNQVNAVQTLDSSLVLDHFQQLESLSSEDTYAIAGCFNYQGKTALYVVNAKTYHVNKNGSDITLHFSTKVSGKTRLHGEEKTFQGNSLTLNSLLPGEGALLILD